MIVWLLFPNLVLPLSLAFKVYGNQSQIYVAEGEVNIVPESTQNQIFSKPNNLFLPKGSEESYAIGSNDMNNNNGSQEPNFTQEIEENAMPASKTLRRLKFSKTLYNDLDAPIVFEKIHKLSIRENESLPDVSLQIHPVPQSNGYFFYQQHAKREEKENYNSFERLLSFLQQNYQFFIIIAFLCVIYVMQLLYSVKFNFRLHKYQIDELRRENMHSFRMKRIICSSLLCTNNMSTFLKLGVNFRGLGETKIVSVSRCFTSSFMHTHIFHFMGNLFCIAVAWFHFSNTKIIENNILWISHWTFPIFIISAVCGNISSFLITLPRFFFSVGASAGCLGLLTGYLLVSSVFEGIPNLQTLYISLIIIAFLLDFVPYEYIFLDCAKIQIDVAANSGGIITGMLMTLVLLWGCKMTYPSWMIRTGDLLSIFLVGLVVLSYIEILREYRFDRKELVTRAFVKLVYLHLATSKTLSRVKGNHLIKEFRGDKLNEELLYLIEYESLEEDYEVVLAKLKQQVFGTGNESPEICSR